MGECRRTVEQLTPYLDGMLPPSEREGVERHLGACPPCRRIATEASGGRSILRERAVPLREAPLPPGLRSRCEALTREHGAHATSWRRRLIPSLAITALVVATVLAVLSMATRRSDVLLAQQLTLDHVKCFHLFASENAMDARDAESWLATQYGWTVHVPPSSASDGISLVGARRCIYAAGTIPHVMYRVHGQNMSLFMLNGVRRKAADVTALGHNSRIWSSGATTYVLVLPKAGSDAAAAIQYVMQRTR